MHSNVNWSKYNWFSFSKRNSQAHASSQQQNQKQEILEPFSTINDPTTAFFEGFTPFSSETRLQQQIALHQLREKRNLETVNLLKSQPQKKQQKEEDFKSVDLKQYLLPVAGAVTVLAAAFVLVRLGKSNKLIAPDGAPLPPPRHLLDKIFVRQYYEGCKMFVLKHNDCVKTYIHT
jgi:hypothetical protein